MAKPKKSEKLSSSFAGLAKVNSMKFIDKVSGMRNGGILRDLRIKAGYTLAELAELTSLSPSYISRLEVGDRRMNSDLIVRLSAALGCSEYELVKMHLGLSEEAPEKSGSKDISNRPRKDVPVYRALDSMAAVGAENEYAVVDFENPASKAYRLPQFFAVQSAFALQISDDLNAPKFRKGDIVFVHPNKNNSRGAPVAIIGTNNSVAIGELLDWDSSSATLRHFGQSKSVVFNRKELASIYPIVATYEEHAETE